MIRLTSTLVVLLCALQAHAQPWVQNRGEALLIVSGSSLEARSIYINGSSVSMERSVMDQTLSAFGEFGVTDKLTLGLQVPLKSVQTSGANGVPTLVAGKLTALGNAELFAKYALKPQAKTVAAAKLHVSLPTASSTEAAGLRTGYPATGVAASVAAGYSNAGFFVWGEPGIVWRSNGFDAEFTAVGEIGYKSSFGLIPILNLNIRQTLAAGTAAAGNYGLTGLYPNGVNWVTASFKLGYEYDNLLGVWFAVGGGSGNLVIAAASYNLAVSLKLKR